MGCTHQDEVHNHLASHQYDILAVIDNIGINHRIVFYENK